MRWIALLMVVALPALAEDEKARRAREELERELTHLVGAQPTKVRIDFEALDEPNYTLEETTFELDGRPLAAPTLATLAVEGSHLVWNGDVAPGKHKVHARIVYANKTSAILTDEGGHTWKVTGDVTFDVHSGIEVQIRVVPSRDGTQPDVTKRFRLALPAKPVMLAQLDDGTMPPPAGAKVTPVDAGTPTVVAAVTPPVEAKEKTRPPPEVENPAAVGTRPVRVAQAPHPEPTVVDDVPVVAKPDPLPAAPEPVVVAPPATPLPAEVAAEANEEADSTPYLIGGGAAAALIVALVLWARRRA